MSNHDHPCRGCGDDLRLIGSAHEADCLARKLDSWQRRVDQARRDLRQALDVLEDGGADDADGLRLVRQFYQAGKARFCAYCEGTDKHDPYVCILSE